MMRVLSVALCAFLFFGCGGSSQLSNPPQTGPTNPPAPTNVKVVCTIPVASGQTTQCTANVLPTGASQNTTFTATAGTITPSGVYTAPVVTADTAVTVTATSTVDTSKSATFNFTVAPPPPKNPPPPPPPPVTTTGPQNLGNGQNIVTRIESNGTIDVAFDTGQGIAVRRSTDNGATFSDPVIALQESEFTDEFQFLLDGGNVFYIFAASTPSGSGTMATLATGDGQTFTSTPISSNGLFPQISVTPDGTIDVLWLDIGTNDLHEFHSKDRGKTFSTDRILWTAGTNSSVDISTVAGTQGQIYVFWDSEADTTCNLLFTTSLDEGNTFAQPLTISPNDAGCYVNPTPKVDAKGNLNIAWTGNGSSVLFSRSTDQGQTFSTPAFAIQNGVEVNALDFAIGPNDEVDLVYDASAIGDNFDVFFTQSLDNGQTFSTPVKLNLPTVQNFTGGGDASIGVDSTDKITVAWDDDSNGVFSGDFDIYERSSTDGKTFTDATDLSNTTDQQEVFPMVIEAANGLYFTWFDTANPQNGGTSLSVFFDANP